MNIRNATRKVGNLIWFVASVSALIALGSGMLASSISFAKKSFVLKCTDEPSPDVASLIAENQAQIAAMHSNILVLNSNLARLEERLR